MELNGKSTSEEQNEITGETRPFTLLELGTTKPHRHAKTPLSSQGQKIFSRKRSQSCWAKGRESSQVKIRKIRKRRPLYMTELVNNKSSKEEDSKWGRRIKKTQSQSGNTQSLGNGKAASVQSKLQVKALGFSLF